MLTVTIIAIAVLLLAWLAAGFFALRLAMRRCRRAQCFLAGHGRFFDWIEPIRPQIKAGVARIRTEQHERCTLKASDGTALAADYYPRENAHGIVIAFHGYASCPENDFCCALGEYLDAGWAVLLVNERACGDSGGQYMTLGVREREDALLWAEKTAGEHPDLPIVLAGVSMGATTVLTATELSLPANVRGIIADCGFESPRSILLDQAKSRYGMLAPVLVLGADFWARVLLGFSLNAISTVRAMKKCRLPVLFMHGSADTFVSPEYTLRAYDACISTDKRFVSVPGAPHVACVPMGGDAVKNEIFEFLRRVGSD